MHALSSFVLSAAAAILLSQPAAAKNDQPLRFFEGRTESSGIIKLVMKKPYKTRSIGHGRIERDGSLVLVQQVEDDGRPPRERRWRIRQVGPRHYSGTMTEAAGPVTIDEVDGRFRFRFKMKGRVSVEQWLSPLPGGMSARSSMKIRKLGMTIGTSTGTIRKLGGS